jgi:myo-inositol-1(or 4)-monophosphatase
MNPAIPTLLAVARQAARSAGEHVLSQNSRRSDTDQVLRHDIKHKLDREAQEIATATILKTFPDHAILGEETAEAALPVSDVRWVIDPIDGTINFTHGLPLWCCSIAAQINETTVAGVVFAPELGLLFEAQADQPAFCNGQPLQVSTINRLDQALIHTGADKDQTGLPSFRFLNRIAEVSQRPRLMGSAALDICWVAAGRTDGYFEPGVYLWDVAAASLILARAGGTGEILQQYAGHKMAFLATNGQLHHPLRETVLPLLPLPRPR